jgi:hypothetical protein
MRIWWEEVAPSFSSLALEYSHSYYIRGTFGSWNSMKLTKMADEECGWETCFRIGPRGREEFQFCRDHDLQQLIYPKLSGSADEGEACGPDDLGDRKNFVATGLVDELVHLQLLVDEGRVTVRRVTKASEVLSSWESVSGMDRHSYCVCGSWNLYNPEEMTRSSDESVWRFSGQMGTSMSQEYRSFYEYFHIRVDGDSRHALYPLYNYATKEECMVQGPDSKGKGAYWLIKSPHAGAKFEIVFNPKALDRRKIVTWTWAEKPVYDFRGGLLALTVPEDEEEEA